ncbi:phospholipid carrier-dependent glycosyltransferase [Rhodocyclus tenuis]|uniref:ArnT family glycosyltransferase n=1 Tax=Rhodocyclus gracilis TaxID=2929842 RepID=UPI001298A7FD|nr:phospholipid carrier-dependent glycosyltransferase [Rhodocyclus gracilis]MRD72242.1 phospholipid carrier-dependent glycosyltransferase [Rhodocyclus gracilis]
MTPLPTRLTRGRWLLYALAALLAVLVYFFDLDGQHIPKNGDEYPYEHIARMTAASGHLLPLQSELDDMRNTKPPMLFWQGIASTNWGADWTLWHLRYPSVIYTLLTALMVFLLATRLARDPGKGFLGALAFLAFFSTYRFGRPFLTNPPEVFWLFLPLFILLYWGRAAFASRSLPLLLGAVIGVGLLYKSFALLLPIGLCLALWYLAQRQYRLGPFLRKDLWKLAVIAVVALAAFSLWFALDPQPQEIWREFVLKENAGKFDPHSSSGYLSKLLWGTSSFWVLVLGYPLNAGLLAFPVIGLMIGALRQRHTLSDAEKLLWIWVLVLLVVFSLPSQRSARYLLAAMPAIAVLGALGWQRISRAWFVLSLVIVAVAVAGLAYLSVRLQAAMPGEALYPLLTWLLYGATILLALAAMARPALTRIGSCVAVLLVFLSLAAFLRPFDGALGQYPQETQRRLAGAEVWVPYDFNAKYELYRFLLPGATIRGYVEEREENIAELASTYPIFAVRVPLATESGERCEVIGQRLDLRGRQTDAEIKAILHGKVLENLFLKELLMECPAATTPAPRP